MFDGVVHRGSGLHPAPRGVQVVVGRRRAQGLLLQCRHRVVAAHAGMVVQGRLLFKRSSVFEPILQMSWSGTCIPNMLAAEAAAAVGQKLLRLVVPATMKLGCRLRGVQMRDGCLVGSLDQL